ncbi:MAG: hypothetical protein BMS9Abin29_1961 [Gemmatimonadota bacterium]|nr:MAG: hypothetical protein BMS9Abin29_1961 [Gemmatimonadota bacterium]
MREWVSDRRREVIVVRGVRLARLAGSGRGPSRFSGTTWANLEGMRKVSKAATLDMTHQARIVILAFLASMLTASMALAQEPQVLTLAEAIELARKNNPTFLSTQNDEAAASWAVREAYSRLFVPDLTFFSQVQYRAPGVQRIGTINTGGVDQGALFTSFYSLNLNWQFNGTRWFRRASASADRSATRARTKAAEFTMESAVTIQYMAVLRAGDQVEVARRARERSQENLEIAQARVAAQAVIITDQKQAEVQFGRDQVTLLQAESSLRVEKFRLMEGLGLAIRSDVTLASEFEVFEPKWIVSDLIGMALDDHPQLKAFVASENARKAEVRQARASYFPSITVTGQWSGFTQEIENGEFLVAQAQRGVANSVSNCRLFNDISSGLSQPLSGFPRNCGAPTLTPETEASILASNNQFPFSFQTIPFQVSLQVSLPVFQGFSRERQVSQASAQFEDARHLRRSEELRLLTAVTSANDALETAHEIVGIEVRNREVAAEQLELARARYRLGADNFFTLLEAERVMADAERAYLDAVYTFHSSLVALEVAVGRNLRPGPEPQSGEFED